MNFLMIHFALLLASINVQARNEPMITLSYEGYKKEWDSKIVNANDDLMVSINSNDPESERRSKLNYETNVNIINEHNIQYNLGKRNHSYGINQFTAWSTEDFKKYLKNNVDVSKLKSTSKKFKPKIKAMRAQQLPASVDMVKERYVTPVRNQGKCATCTAFSAVAALEGQYAKKTNKLISFSEQCLVDCSPIANMCKNGGTTEELYDFLLNAKLNGLPSQSSYPYRGGYKNRCSLSSKQDTERFIVTDYQHIDPSDKHSIQETLATVGPITTYISASYRDFQHYKGGVISNKNICGGRPDHAVTMIGYDSDSYLFKNSWGQVWGNDGFFRLSNLDCVFIAPLLYPVITLNQNRKDGNYKKVMASNNWSSIPGKYRPVTFTILNDQDFDLKLYCIDFKRNAKLFQILNKQNSFTRVSSYSGHVWLLLNEAKQKCIVFRLGEPGQFLDPVGTVAVSRITGYDCDPNEKI